jgi:hypothetical protein
MEKVQKPINSNCTTLSPVPLELFYLKDLGEGNIMVLCQQELNKQESAYSLTA